MRRKELLQKKMLEDMEIGYLDRDIVDVLKKLFENRDLYTISSCSGRITFIDADMPWHRRNSSVVFKKHFPITEDEFMYFYKQPTLRNLWLVVTGPIIHVSSATPSEARKLLVMAREAGMKHSGIISISRTKGIIIELKTGVRLTILLKIHGESVVRCSEIPGIVKVANTALLEGKERLNRFRKVLGLKPVKYRAF